MQEGDILKTTRPVGYETEHGYLWKVMKVKHFPGSVGRGFVWLASVATGKEILHTYRFVKDHWVVVVENKNAGG